MFRSLGFEKHYEMWHYDDNKENFPLDKVANRHYNNYKQTLIEVKKKKTNITKNNPLSKTPTACHSKKLLSITPKIIQHTPSKDLSPVKSEFESSDTNKTDKQFKNPK